MCDTPLFATQLVGSWVKPRWLCDHDLVYGPEGSWWKLPAEDLPGALDDAVEVALSDQGRAGLTYQTDGEQRRQSFSGYFYRIEGIDSDQMGVVTNFKNDIGDSIKLKLPKPAPDAPKPTFEQPRVVGDLRWPGPMLQEATHFLKERATGQTKVTMIGPCTLALRLVDENYGSLERLTLALADVINEELRSVDALGVDLIQIDEPEVHFRYSQVAGFAAQAIDRALSGLTARTAVHMCYGYARSKAEKSANPVYGKALQLLAGTSVDDISVEYAQPGHSPELLANAGDKTVILGVLNLHPDAPVETAEEIVALAEGAMSVVDQKRLRLAPDCGMWFLPRATAVAKIQAMEEAARILRSRYDN
ncbi:MAG TPA: hypothetical protein DIU15_08865 [Deltaproteobacteria bacterium]|nr:hypothetical protein [Deltaproteobacteria bacterium]HCP46139.1 hypothetical protein [Deltaproteobacteria bacterium]